MKDKFLTTRFGLIRHARTVWNREKRIQGQMDSALLPEGLKSAGKWGVQLKPFGWNRILTSDTGRALETARRINEVLQCPLDQDRRLREQDWGAWTGKTLAQVKQEDPVLLADQIAGGWKFRPPDGEPRKSVLQRSRAALEEAAWKWTGTCILVVTHEGVIKSLVYHLGGRRFLPTEPPLLRPRHLHFLCADRQGLRNEKINAVKLHA